MLNLNGRNPRKWLRRTGNSSDSLAKDNPFTISVSKIATGAETHPQVGPRLGSGPYFVMDTAPVGQVIDAGR